MQGMSFFTGNNAGFIGQARALETPGNANFAKQITLSNFTFITHYRTSQAIAL